jgi:nicotinic acid mononucleotide adenylyltransferase
MTPLRLGLFPAAFNPPTNAHAALIRAAAAQVEPSEEQQAEAGATKKNVNLRRV